MPLPGGSIGQKDMYLPAKWLPVGEYVVSLKARMAGTGVYALETGVLRVIETPRRVYPHGGMWKTVGELSNVSLEVDIEPGPEWSS